MIILIVLFVIIFFFLFGNSLRKSYITKLFRKDSVLVFGKKGKGKDLLFQMVIKKRRSRYYSNINYGAKHLPLKVLDLSCDKNTFLNMINYDITKFAPKFEEGLDVYISDSGVYFPSQYFQLLDKTFASMPLYMALSRHLYKQNVHCNCQAISRVWDKIREQFGYYIKCVDSKVFFRKIVYQKVCIYDRYNDAFEDVRPFKPVKRKRSDEVVAQKAVSDQKYGLIKEISFWYILPRDHYDTRYFKDIMLSNCKE